MTILFIIISVFNLIFVNNAQMTSKCLADLSNARNCPAGWVSYEDVCYFIEKSTKMKLDDAKKYCLNEGGRLVRFDDDKDFNFVTLKIQEIAINKSARWFTAGELILTGSAEYSWNGYGASQSVFSIKAKDLFVDGVPKSLNEFLEWDKTRVIVALGTDGNKWKFHLVKKETEQYFVCQVSKGLVAKQLPRKRLADFNQVDALNIKRGPCITKQPNDQLYLPKVLGTNVVTFEVQFLGNPKPEVTWYFVTDTNITKLDPKIFTNGEVSQTDGILIISNPANDDRFNSKIQAHITNEFGTVTSQVVQIIKGALESYQSGASMTQVKKVNEGFMLDCKVPYHYPKESLQYTFMESRTVNGIQKDTPIQPRLRKNIFLSQNLGMIGFSTVLERDEAKYICMIQWKDLPNGGSSFNSPEFVLKVVQPTLPEPNPSVDQNFPNIRPSKPKLGDKIVIECFGYGTTKTRQLTYFWQWKGMELSSRHKVTDLGRRIIIDDVQFEDQGDFSCSVKDVSRVSQPKVVTLSLNAVPTFINRPLNQYVDNGANATFICGAIGIPDIKMFWYRNSQRLDAFLANPLNQKDAKKYQITAQGFKITSSTLTISNVKSTDNAMIGCQISNSYRTKSSYAELKTFAFKPNFKKYPITNIEAMEGQYAIIPCQPEGAPKPTIVWKRNGSPISTPPVQQNKVNGDLKCDSDYCILQNNNLNVSNVKASTKGQYTCQATNEYGSAESTGYLEVVDAVKPTLEPVGRRIRLGSNVVLPCQASSSPSMDVDYDWYFENVRIRFDRLDRDARRYDISQFERPYNKYFGYMTISNIQFYDEGFYTCKITTPVTSTSHDAFYQVIGPPGESGGIVIKKVNDSSFTVVWTDGTSRGYPITKYLLQKREYNLGDPTWYKMEEISFNETTPIKVNERLTRRVRHFSGLPASTRFQIRIIAYNMLGEGTPSPPSEVFSTTAIPPTKIPQNVTGGGGKVFTLVVQWNKIDRIDENGPQFGFDVQYRQRKDDSWLGSADNIVFRNISELGVDKYRQATISLSDLKYYKLYQVRVRAKNIKGPGPWTKVHEIYSAPNMPQFSVKNVEVNSLNSTALEVYWQKPQTKPEEGVIIGFHIIYWVRNHPCKDQQAYFDRLKSSQRLSLYRQKVYMGVIIGLEPDTYYCVGVQSINAAGDGPESSFFDQTTFKKAPQNWPTLVILNSTGLPGTLRVRFNGVRVNPDEESVDGYTVRYWPTGAPVKTALDKNAGMKTETFVSGLRYDIRYNLRVFAYSRGGVGKLSNPMIQFTLIPKNKCVKDLVTEGVDVTFVFICGACSKSISLTLLLFSIILCLVKQFSNSI